jgi:hypothetical protein
LKSVRNFFRRVFRPRPAPNPPRVEFSYTIYWTKQVRGWDAARRAAIAEALWPVLAQPGFEANAYARRYSVPGLDAQAHSGASLLALKKVLEGFERDERRRTKDE